MLENLPVPAASRAVGLFRGGEAATVQWASRLLARSSREGRRRRRIPHAGRESPWGPVWARGLGSTHLQTFAKKSAAHLAWRRETIQRPRAALPATGTHRSRRRGHSTCLPGVVSMLGRRAVLARGAGQAAIICEQHSQIPKCFFPFFLPSPRESQPGPTATQDAPPHSTPFLGRAALRAASGSLPGLAATKQKPQR